MGAHAKSWSASLAPLAVLLTACGGAPESQEGASASSTTFPTSPLSTLTSDGGKLHVALHSAPEQPLAAGVDSVELVVTEAATGAAMDGLTVTMTPWMPAMGHGASVTPLVTPLGEGKYVFTNVSLFMPGEWQLRVQFSGAGEMTDSVEPTFNVD